MSNTIKKKKSTNRIGKKRGLSLGTLLSSKPLLTSLTCGLTANHFLISLRVLAVLKCTSESGRGRKVGLDSNQQRHEGNDLIHLALSRKVHEDL